MKDRTLVATPDPDEPKPYARTSITLGPGNTTNVVVYTPAQITWTGTSTGHFAIFRSV